MKVVVAAAPLRDFYFTPHRFSALGSRIIRRILSRRGISCTLLDFPVMRSRRLPLPRTLSHLEPYLLPSERGRLSFFRSYHHYGPSLPECARRIRSENPDLLLISCFAFCYADEARWPGRSERGKRRFRSRSEAPVQALIQATSFGAALSITSLSARRRPALIHTSTPFAAIFGGRRCRICTAGPAAGSSPRPR